jgi:acyl-CoA synthetase (NDP forming)/RimJ/RimL family protein N-acetyltransferase
VPDAPVYPVHWEADVVLRDGGTCHLRPMRSDDADRLREFHSRLSPETIYYRFFAPYPTLSDRDVARFTQVDYDRRAAIVATIGEEIIGVVRYDWIHDVEAEVAFVIRDDYQGRGLATIFLEHIAQAARERGIQRFVAEILPENIRMIDVFRHAGYQSVSDFVEGVVRMEFAIEPTAESLAVSQAREHRAESRSIQRLLSARSVAVVGAGRDEDNLGHRVLRHLLDGGFPGAIHPVNPHADSIAGRPAVASLRDLAEPVELVVVAVPAAAVADVVGDAAVNGALGLVVVSDGFAETGEDGAQLQHELVASARSNGMRVIGPNALGVINTAPEVALNASVSPIMPGRGHIGFFSQSGALGIALLEAVVRRGLGLSTFVSAGNRADVSGNDLLQYWEEDATTDVVLLYLESIGNPRKFSRIARRLARHKPVVAVRVGRASQGAPVGHSVRTTDLPVAAIDAMFSQSGVIQVETLGEMFDVAQLVAFQPLPHGRRVALLSNSDAMALMAVDAIETNGLELVEPPVVFRPNATAEDYRHALAGVVDDPAVDAVVALYIPTALGVGGDVARAIARVAYGASKPVAAVMVAVPDAPDLLDRVSDHGVPGSGTVPTYSAVEDAARALAAVVRYADWRRRPAGEPVEPPGIEAERGRALVDAALADVGADQSVQLDDAAATELLAAYGIDLWPSRVVQDAPAALAAAEELGYPVVLKSRARVLRESSDWGGVHPDLTTPEQLTASVEWMRDQLAVLGMTDMVVQRMAPTGVAVEVTSREDRLFGPVVSFGVSGVATDLMDDRAYRIPPLTDVDVDDLISTPRAAPLLRGRAGGLVVDDAALRDLVARLGRMSDDLPQLADVELRPVIVAPKGLAVVGARVTLREPLRRVDAPVRRLLG